MIEEALEEVEEASVIEGAEADSRVADVINTNLSIFVLVFYCFQCGQPQVNKGFFFNEGFP